MSFGKGMALGYSWKHKQTAKSLTEGELYGVDNTLGHILWARYFMQEQGYDMEPSLTYQDNMSAILLKINGKFSSSKRTKHIKIKYYHMKGKKEDGEIQFKHCPTEQMWADIYINTKPKQGAVFREFRGHVMGVPANYNDDDYKHVIPSTVSKLMLPMTKAQWALKECVGGDSAVTPLGNLNVVVKRNTVDRNVKRVSWDPPKESVDSVMDNWAQQLGSVRNNHDRIRMVEGRKWCVTTYQSCWLRGEPLEKAWKQAFIM
jgi:hypothetical protein